MRQSYCVAGHRFAIEAKEELFAQLTNYAPFSTDQSDASHVFIIRMTEDEIPSSASWEHIYTDVSDDDMPRIEMYRKEGEWLFLVAMTRDGEIVTAMRCSADWSDVQVYADASCSRFALDNATMLVYAFSTIDKQTLLFHASVIKRGKKGYLFLGHSGTGKSTHSQQWLAAFEDAELLNDDNPVVRMENGAVQVYGSPWSGKTPCYKNSSAQVAAFVQLVQAPENKIERLRMTQAYPYILASVSGLKILPEMMDRIYESIARLLELSPVYRLECLPNPDAARLCAQTCSL